MKASPRGNYRKLHEMSRQDLRIVRRHALVRIFLLFCHALARPIRLYKVFFQQECLGFDTFCGRLKDFLTYIKLKTVQKDIFFITFKPATLSATEMWKFHHLFSCKETESKFFFALFQYLSSLQSLLNNILYSRCHM